MTSKSRVWTKKNVVVFELTHANCCCCYKGVYVYRKKMRENSKIELTTVISLVCQQTHFEWDLLMKKIKISNFKTWPSKNRSKSLESRANFSPWQDHLLTVFKSINFTNSAEIPLKPDFCVLFHFYTHACCLCLW